MALGSRAELETQLLLAKRLTYGNPERIHDCLAQLDELGRMLCGLQKSLRAKLD
jgi:four helix bundle protein